MPTIESIISRGFFPKELPPPFTPQMYGTFLSANHNTLPSSFHSSNNTPAKLSIHNLARSGSLRRKLGIPNAVNFYHIASLTVDNWQELHRHASRSTFSLTTPVDGFLRRAIERRYILMNAPLEGQACVVLHAIFCRQILVGFILRSILTASDRKSVV